MCHIQSIKTKTLLQLSDIKAAIEKPSASLLSEYPICIGTMSNTELQVSGLDKSEICLGCEQLGGTLSEGLMVNSQELYDWWIFNCPRMPVEVIMR